MLNGTVVSHNAVINTVSHNTLLNGAIVSYNTVTNGNIASHSTVPNGNIVSNSIETPNNIVTCNIVDISNLSLSKHLSYSFPLASIRNINGIDFNFHSHLYFDVQHWISSLIPMLRLLISSFRLECFLLFSRHDSPSCRSLKSSLTILQASFPTWHISTYSLSSSSFGSNFSCHRSLIHGSSRHILSHSSFTPDSAQEFPDATPWLSPIINSLLFSLFTVDNLSPSQNRYHIPLPFTNLCYNVLLNTMHLWVYRLTPQ